MTVFVQDEGTQQDSAGPDESCRRGEHELQDSCAHSCTGGYMKPYGDVAVLVAAQIVCFFLLSHFETDFFPFHFYQAILYIAILMMLFFEKDQWASMIALLTSIVWLGIAFVSGVLSSSMRELFDINSTLSNTQVVTVLTLITASIAVLMIGFCGRHWLKGYPRVGDGRKTFLVSLGCVAVYYPILGLFLLQMVPNR
jgi:hypothetical protein